MNFGGFIALLIGLGLWGLIIFTVILLIRAEREDSRKEAK